MAALKRLAAGADALIENLRGDQAAKLGLDYAALKDVNPKIVCAHISAYGRDNDRANRPGYDFLMQAEAGLMDLTGDPEGDPTRYGPSIIDFMSGITCVVGLLSCIIGARKTGLGCDVDTSLFEVALHQLSYSATYYMNDGFQTQRLSRSSHFANVPSQTFRAANGWIFIMCMTDKFWQLLVEKIGLPQLAHDARFATMADRRENRGLLTEILDAKFETQSMDFWVEQLGATVPIGPVNDIRNALESEFVERLRMIQSVPHPAMAKMRLLANPLRINGERLQLKPCSALGADTNALIGAGDISTKNITS